LAPFLSTTATSCKPACTSTDRTNRWAPCTTWNSPIHPQEHKPAQSLGRLIPPKKNWIANIKL
jgi:hypothetical protein